MNGTKTETDGNVRQDFPGGFPAVGIDLDEGLLDVVHLDLGVLGRKPDMRIGPDGRETYEANYEKWAAECRGSK